MSRLPILDELSRLVHNRSSNWRGAIGAESGGCVERSMEEFWQDPIVQLILWSAIFLVLLAIATYAVLKIRAEAAQSEPPSSEMLSKFRELHVEGDLSDEEFRTIKTALAEQLQDELKNTGEKG